MAFTWGNPATAPTPEHSGLVTPLEAQMMAGRLPNAKLVELPGAFHHIMLDRPSAFNRELLEFFADRLKVQQRDAGVRYDLIDAVFALGGEDDLVRLLARVEALQQFVETPEGADLLAAYKRAANILKKEKWEGSGGQGIPQTGDEDPYVLVDEPVMSEAVGGMITASTLPARAEDSSLSEQVTVNRCRTVTGAPRRVCPGGRQNSHLSTRDGHAAEQ